MNEPNSPRYRSHRFPVEVIAHAVWLYFRFPLSLGMAEDLLSIAAAIASGENGSNPPESTYLLPAQ